MYAIIHSKQAVDPIFCIDFLEKPTTSFKTKTSIFGQRTISKFNEQEETSEKNETCIPRPHRKKWKKSKKKT